MRRLFIIQNYCVARIVDAREVMSSWRRAVHSDGGISIDLLELMHKKAFNRRRLSSPTISDDYPIAVLKEVQKSRHRKTTFKLLVTIANVRCRKYVHA